MKAIAILLMLAAAISLAATPEATNIEVNLINQIPDPVEPGDSVELSFRFSNTGSAVLDDFTVELLPEYPFQIFESAVKDLGSLDARQSSEQSVIIKYNVVVDENADEGTHEIHLRYKLSSGNWAKVGPFKVTVKPVEAIVTVLSAESNQPFKAGARENFKVELENTGKSLLKNLRVKLNLDQLPFAPIGTSNEKVISSVAPGEKVKLNFDLAPHDTAKSGTYKASLSLDFIDDSGKNYSRSSNVGLIVYDQPEFKLALKNTAVYTPDSAGEIVLSVSNIGPSEIKFMTMELLDTAQYQVISPPIAYLGNLEADDFETAEFEIKTSKSSPAAANLKVKLTYKDSRNKEITTEETVKLPIYSSRDAEKFGLVKTNRNILSAYLMTGMLIISIVFVLFMLVDCLKNPLVNYKKLLWTIVILTGIGAIFYYFIARRRR